MEHNHSKEMQLEQVAERAIKNAQQLNLAPPIFELYAALLALSIAIVMFLMPHVLESNYGLHDVMVALFPQSGWALSFFAGGMAVAIGMLLNKVWLRVLGLVILSAIYGTLTLIYALLLPNFGFILMFWITIFTIASIPLVKYTGIWNKTEKGDD